MYIGSSLGEQKSRWWRPAKREKERCANPRPLKSCKDTTHEYGRCDDAAKDPVRVIAAADAVKAFIGGSTISCLKLGITTLLLRWLVRCSCRQAAMMVPGNTLPQVPSTRRLMRLEFN